MAMFVSATAGRREVFRQKYSYTPSAATVEPAIVTGDFELPGRNSSVEVTTNTDLHGNDWTYFSYALVNRAGGTPQNFGRQVSHTTDKAVLPSIPAGHYYLRVEPEKPTGTSPINFEIVVRRDVPSFGWFWVAAFLLLIPAVFTSMRSGGFESARWRESDLGS